MTEAICGFCEVEFTPKEPRRHINDVPYHSCNQSVPCFYEAMQHMKNAVCNECDQPIKPTDPWCIINSKTYHYKLCTQ